MRYRHLGRSGLQVSLVGFGSWLTVRRHGRDVADRLHRAAYEGGVNFFDTANVYGHGETEATVGAALRPFRRDTYVLATKVYFPYGDHPFPEVNDRGLSRKHVMEQCHRSLRELGTDYVDLYQCHRYDANTPLVETCRVMNDLVTQGKVLYWGVSQWTADQIREAVEICDEHDWPRPISDQPQYNLLQRGQEEDVFPTCGELGLGLVVYSPLAQGVLTGKYRPGEAPPPGSRGADEHDNRWMGKVLDESILAKVEQLRELAEGMGHTTAQLALAWCHRRPELASTIVGATRVEQLEENIAAGDIELDDHTLDAIKVIFGE